MNRFPFICSLCANAKPNNRKHARTIHTIHLWNPRKKCHFPSEKSMQNPNEQKHDHTVDIAYWFLYSADSLKRERERKNAFFLLVWCHSQIFVSPLTTSRHNIAWQHIFFFSFFALALALCVYAVRYMRMSFSIFGSGSTEIENIIRIRVKKVLWRERKKHTQRIEISKRMTCLSVLCLQYRRTICNENGQ